LGLVSDYGNTVIPRKIKGNSSAHCTVFFYFWADILNLGLSFTECPRRRSQAMFDHHVHQGKFGAFPHSQITAIYSWLVVWNMNFKTFHSVGDKKSSQLIFTPSFFRGIGHPPTRMAHVQTILNPPTVGIKIVPKSG
jgi:hypothetical protein